jgi:hypothetical protein
MLSWISAFPANKAVPRYVVAKDDVSQQILNSATFYTVGAGGTPSPATTVLTRAGDGIAGGFTTRTTTALHARNTCGTCGKLAMFNGEFKKVL